MRGCAVTAVAKTKEDSAHSLLFGVVSTSYDLFIPLGKSGVTTIEVFRFYILGAVLRPLKGVEENMHFAVALPSLYEVQRYLSDFIQHPETALWLGDSVDAALAVFDMVGYLIQRAGRIGPQNFSAQEAENLKKALAHLESSLYNDLKKLPLFCVTTKGNYSTDKLLGGASLGLGATHRQSLSPECTNEIDEAGRCLALGRATASGFHVLRSVELVIRDYVKRASGTLPPLNRQNWGEYISLLGKHGAAKEVTDLVQNIKDNYRNPLMHPEDTLEEDDAISLFGVCQSTIESLVRDMKKRALIK
jgi:hypothetical protein